MKKKTRGLLSMLLALTVLAALAACGGPTGTQNDPGPQSSDRTGQAEGDPRLEDPVQPEELGWDRTTLKGYLVSRTAHTLLHEGYSSLTNEGIERLREYPLEWFDLTTMEEGTVELNMPLADLFPGTVGTLNVKTGLYELKADQLYTGQKEAWNEQQLKDLLCQGTQDAPWHSVDVFETGWDAPAAPYYLSVHNAWFTDEGTCELTGGEAWSDVVNGYKGTYLVNGDRLTIQISEAQELVPLENDEGYDIVWSPRQKTLEYQLLPTQTGMAFVQLGVNGIGFSATNSTGSVLSWQKEEAFDYTKPSLSVAPEPTSEPDEPVFEDKPTGVQDASDLYNTQWTYHTKMGPFSLELREDGTYSMEIYMVGETQEGAWSYQDGTLYIDDLEFVEQNDDGKVGFFHEDGEFSISIY